MAASVFFTATNSSAASSGTMMCLSSLLPTSSRMNRLYCSEEYSGMAVNFDASPLRSFWNSSTFFLSASVFGLYSKADVRHAAGCCRWWTSFSFSQIWSQMASFAAIAASSFSADHLGSTLNTIRAFSCLPSRSISSSMLGGSCT